MNIQESKAALRKQIRPRLETITSAARDTASTHIRARLLEQPFWKNSASALFFSPLPDEADIWPLLADALASGKTCALPHFDAASQMYIARRVNNLKGEIVTGKFGILEPNPDCAEVPTGTLDLVLVPGVAFDLSGRRLGRGKGFYDRLLQKVRGLKIGIAFDEQILEKIPAEPHDMKMDFILTPSGCVKSAG